MHFGVFSTTETYVVVIGSVFMQIISLSVNYRLREVSINYLELAFGRHR